MRDVVSVTSRQVTIGMLLNVMVWAARSECEIDLWLLPGYERLKPKLERLPYIRRVMFTVSEPVDEWTDRVPTSTLPVFGRYQRCLDADELGQMLKQERNR